MNKSLGIFLLLLNGLMAAGQTHVQTSTLFQTTTATTIARTFSTASTTGNLIVVHLDWDGQTRSILTVTDNKGNSYARINGPTNWNGTSYRAELWYAYNITGGGAAVTVTAKLNGAPTSYSQIYITEYSGIVTTDPLDQNTVATGTALAVSSASVNTNYSNELIYGASIGASGNLSTGTGFTNRSTANSNIIEDKKALTSGSYAATFTSVSGNKWVAQMATFITTSSSIVLPVAMTSFTGSCNGTGAILNWEAGEESNNIYFTPQRSVDGNHWIDLGKVDATGNGSTGARYSFDAVNSETAFFRIRQTDADARNSYSTIISINSCAESQSGLVIYPNPSAGRSVSVRNPAFSTGATRRVVIYDNMGRIVYRGNLVSSDGTIYFDRPLTSGIYHLQVVSSGQARTGNFAVRP